MGSPWRKPEGAPLPAGAVTDQVLHELEFTFLLSSQVFDSDVKAGRDE